MIKFSTLKSMRRQLGQGMSEYIIIVALIAIAAIGVAGFFGDTVSNQMASMSSELAGGDGAAAQANAEAQAVKAVTEAAKAKRLDDYHSGNQTR